MPDKPSRIRTLRDLDLLEGSASIPNPSSTSTIKIAHIPTLPQGDACLQLLRRIHNEFFPIIQRRGYKVLSISEFCCCGDGLDHDHQNGQEQQENNNQTGGANGTGIKRNKGGQKQSRRHRRRTVVKNKNIMGYNQSHWNGSHTIHLRMRNAQNHSVLLSYEHVAGTMAHELAHCVHGPHSVSFYKLMDEISEQHAVLLTRGVVADVAGFPMNSAQAYVLGRGENKGNTTTSTAAAAEAIRQSSHRWMPQGPQRLGGDETFSNWCTPAEAAAMAAVQRRRLLDEVWCQPCNNDDRDTTAGATDILDLMSSSDEETMDVQKERKRPALQVDEVHVVDNDNAITKPIDVRHVPAKLDKVYTTNRDRNTANDINQRDRASLSSVIDLTADNDEGDGPSTSASIKRVSGWSCIACTFSNTLDTMVCSMCRKERGDASAKAISEMVRNDVIGQVQQLEGERSQEEFGFNIYGTSKMASCKMKHLS